MLLKVILISIIYLVYLQNAAAYDVPGRSLKPGTYVIIRGDLPLYGDSNLLVFTVNYQEPNGDIGFHMSVRYNRNSPESSRVVLNSRIDDKWQREEIHYGIPRAYGYYKNHFVIDILATEDHFEFSINDRKYPHFKYRTDIENITSLLIYHLQSTSVEWD